MKAWWVYLVNGKEKVAVFASGDSYAEEIIKRRFGEDAKLEYLCYESYHMASIALKQGSRQEVQKELEELSNITVLYDGMTVNDTMIALGMYNAYEKWAKGVI